MTKKKKAAIRKKVKSTIDETSYAREIEKMVALEVTALVANDVQIRELIRTRVVDTINAIPTEDLIRDLQRLDGLEKLVKISVSAFIEENKTRWLDRLREKFEDTLRNVDVQTITTD